MNGQAAGERKRLAPDERRQMIVDEAAAFFAQYGLEGTTRELSQRIGVTQSLIYAYFSSKADLLEAVFERIYLDRLSPDWPTLIADRSQPVRNRTIRFYREYTAAIFTYEWMRIFMFSGLAGTELNRRYLEHLSKLVLHPLWQEMCASVSGSRKPTTEDIWNLHGGIVYIGIRKFVYCVPTPDDYLPAVEDAVNRFCDSFGI
jgi:AcrR family transcriptional regulator